MAALKEVRHWLPLAAQRTCADDGENVHRLRVATRRASVALKVFSDLTDPVETNALREELRQIRKAADSARDVDATFERFVTRAHGADEALGEKLRERLHAMRDQAQAPIAAIERRLTDSAFDERAMTVLCDMLPRHPKRAGQTFGERARKLLKPALQRFFKAAKGKLSDDAGVHHLRIQAKKLRYTMEILSNAFKPSFSDKLYRQFCDFQDVLGAVRDRVIMQDMLRSWLTKPSDDAERAFLQNLLQMEKNAHAESMREFHAMWTPKYIRKLKSEFAKHIERQE